MVDRSSHLARLLAFCAAVMFTLCPVVSAGAFVARARLEVVDNVDNAAVGHLGRQSLKATPVKPRGHLEVLSDAPGELPYFTVRVAGRDILGVAYRSTGRSRRMKLLLDTDGDGLLSDEKENLCTGLRGGYQFGPVATGHGDTQAAGGASYVQYWPRGNGRFTFYPAFYHQGQIVLGGKAYTIAVADCDYDGRYNGVFVPSAKDSLTRRCDALAIDLDGNSKFDSGLPGSSEVMPLSRMIKVNEHYYSIEVAEDGSTIEFRRAEPSFGQLEIGSNEVDLRLWSDAGHPHLRGSESKWRIPVGKYSVMGLELIRKDSAGKQWAFKLAKPGDSKLGNFEIRPGETTSLKVGGPFRIRTTMERKGPNFSVGFDIEGRGGELYLPCVKANGLKVPVPHFNILDGSGQTVASGQFKYG